MVRRNVLAQDTAARVSGGALVIQRADTGWPSLARVTDASGRLDIALHVGPVGLSQRDRDNVERRFQNPGSNRPVLSPDGRLPVLLGVWENEGRTVFVGLDGTDRIGRPTRFSLFVPLSLLQAAATSGWEEQYSTSGERLTAFAPDLLPQFVRMLETGVDIEPSAVAAIVAASGMSEDADPAAVERGRRSVSTLVRDARFSRDVRAAYSGRCAMCGMRLSLVVGAHIHPVAAPGAPDTVWNGIALCQHHHTLFDAHKIYVDPVSRTIRLHPSLVAGRAESDANRVFVDGTFPTLAEPESRRDRPREGMFQSRYGFFGAQYDWATG